MSIVGWPVLVAANIEVAITKAQVVSGKGPIANGRMPSA